MDVGVYVTELLQKLDEVSLSGIGTFYKKRTSAYHDNKQGIFFPPSEEYAFDPDRQSSSNVLIDYVCHVRNISEPSARYFIEKYIDSLKQSMQIKGYAAIDSIGKLRAANNSYVFEAAQLDSSPLSYGLIPVMEIERKAKRNNNEPDFSAIRIKTPAAAVPEQQPPLIEKEKKESPEKSNSPAILIVIAFLALGAAIVAGYFLYPKFFQPKDKAVTPKVATTPAVTPKIVDSTNQTATTKDVNASEAQADSLFDKSITQLGQEQGITVEKPRDTNTITITSKSIDSKKKDTESATQTTPVNPSSSVRFEVIVAAFNKQSEAEDAISRLRKKGIDAKVVNDTRKPKFKISTGTFTNEEAAQKERRRLQEANIAKDAWVFTVKNK